MHLPKTQCAANLKRPLRLLTLTIALFGALPALAAPNDVSIEGQHLIASGPATGLADSVALRATVYGTAAHDIAPLPERVPLAQIDVSLPWARPAPDVFWFNRRLRVWFSAQDLSLIHI